MPRQRNTKNQNQKRHHRHRSRGTATIPIQQLLGCKFIYLFENSSVEGLVKFKRPSSLHIKTQDYKLRNTMAGNDTIATQDQRGGSTASILSNRELPTSKATKGNGSKPTTGNGKTSKHADGEMKDMTHQNDTNNNANTNTSGTTSRHAPRLPTRTNKTKRKSASTTTDTTTGPTPPQPSSTSRAAPSVTHHHRALNPLLLARGMSSRYLSTKIISASSSSSNSSTPTSILPLSKTDIEKDLRHMETYRAASIGYGQQLFVYKNQELVRSGYFGSFFVGPGVLGDGSVGGEHVGGDGYYHPAVMDDTIRAPYHDEVDQEGSRLINVGGENEDPRAPTRPVGGKRGSSQRKHQNRGRPYMPIKIDPEEEKRLSGLRKRMHHSEFVRMQLETQYLSLRSHYVHESQLVRKTRSYEMEGRLKLMREVMVRREKVLALMRVKMAIWRDVEVRLLGYRDGWNVGGTEDDPVVENKKDASYAAAGEKAEEESKEAVENEADAENKKVDLLKIWNDINSQLKAAEAACMELETPAVLTQMVVTPTPSPPSSSASSATSIAKNGRKRSSSITSTEEAANNNNDSTSGKRRVSSSSSSGLEPHIIPWDCMVEPQTPYDLPLLLSCLSSATDRVAGYVTDKKNPSAITWLESTLPQSTSAYDKDADDLKKLQEEVRALEDELQRECVRNTELREQVNASRTRSDEMVALMQLLRSETEAVLERHNVIMETPEAIAKAAELHQRRVEEEKLKNPPVEGEEEEEEDEDDEEGEVDENEEFSSGEEEINRYGEQQESDDELYDSVGIKEITVDNDSNNEAGESDDDDEDGSDGGDVAEDEDGEEEEPRTRSKRRGHEDEDDMSNSSSTPPNSSSYRKRRRY